MGDINRNKKENDIRILIIGPYDFVHSNATSITLASLFSGLNKRNIAFINTSSVLICDYPSIHLEPRFFNQSKIDKVKVFKKISKNRSLVSGQITFNGKSFKKKILQYFHTLLSSYRSLLPFHYTKEVDTFIDEFKPDLIYSLLGRVCIMNFCLKVSKKKNIPIVPHFMDDWYGVQFAHNILLFPARLILLRSINRIMNKVPMGLTISQKMEKEYTKIFSIPFRALMNSVDIPVFKEYKKDTEKLVLSYAGGLHLDRGSSLYFLCKVLSKINKKITLNIYTSEENWEKYFTLFSEFEFVCYGGFHDHNIIMEKLNKSDILIHVESFSNEVKDYTRLSISTKIPEYLALQKTIIAVGPDDVASIEYLKDNKCAFIISELDLNKSVAKLKHLSDNVQVDFYKNNAIKLFEKNHYLNNQQALLYKTFQEAIKDFKR